MLTNIPRAAAILPGAHAAALLLALGTADSHALDTHVLFFEENGRLEVVKWFVDDNSTDAAIDCYRDMAGLVDAHIFRNEEVPPYLCVDKRTLRDWACQIGDTHCQ